MRLLLLTLFTLAGVSAFSQSILDQKAVGANKGKSLTVFLQEFENAHPARFYFLETWLDKIELEENLSDQTLREVLDELFLGTELNYILLNEHDVVIVKDPTQAIQRKNLISTAQRERKKIEQVLLGASTTAKTNKRVLLKGQVIDSKNQTPLVGSTIQVKDISLVAISNQDGKYEVQVPVGEHILIISYVNYEEKVIEVGAFLISFMLN